MLDGKICIEKVEMPRKWKSNDRVSERERENEFLSIPSPSSDTIEPRLVLASKHNMNLYVGSDVPQHLIGFEASFFRL